MVRVRVITPACQNLALNRMSSSNLICFFQLVNLLTRKVKQSVAAVCLSVRLFPLYILNRLSFELDFVRVCVGHDHSSA